jgi:hypothetical protein
LLNVFVQLANKRGLKNKKKMLKSIVGSLWMSWWTFGFDTVWMSNYQLYCVCVISLQVAFRTGQSTRLDDRLFAMCQMKTLPLTNLIQTIYPDMYPVHYLDDKVCLFCTQNCFRIKNMIAIKWLLAYSIGHVVE